MGMPPLTRSRWRGRRTGRGQPRPDAGRGEFVPHLDQEGQLAFDAGDDRLGLPLAEQGAQVVLVCRAVGAGDGTGGDARDDQAGGERVGVGAEHGVSGGGQVGGEVTSN
ncbi:hypothetical protein [Streptomyces sp. CFMR 7]|uniref:hypothetical protein n=1 Tax=Streptomyces sp. CFMR 7 TaxID=1649184 RepID=UPI0011A37F04|nr:hypothetical protein [Streptomyces sp. CFMR 7]